MLIGSRHSANTLRLKEFLTRNGQPFTYQDVEREAGVQAMLERFQVGIDEVPVVLCCAGGHLMRNPSVEEVAEPVGPQPSARAYCGARRRDCRRGARGLGGRGVCRFGGARRFGARGLGAGWTGRHQLAHRKFPRLPHWNFGASLGRACAQARAEKFGAEVAIARRAVRLDCDSRPYKVHLANGDVVQTKTVVIATGARYRRPELRRTARALRGRQCTSTALRTSRRSFAIMPRSRWVGGGNSAGQAAVFLAQFATKVHVLIRGAGLADSMSRYLIRRIEDSPKVTLRTRTNIEALEGTDRLERLRWRTTGDGDSETHSIGHLFLMTGADPNTAWVRGCVAMDNHQFVKTGPDLSSEELTNPAWNRAPYLLETSIPGVFAVGDARAGSVKRVASAVGEGSICVQLIHQALRDL